MICGPVCVCVFGEGMYENFESSLSRLELRAMEEWQRLSTSTSGLGAVVLPAAAAPAPTNCVHLTPKLHGSGPSYRLQLTIRNTTGRPISDLRLSLHCTGGKFSCTPWCRKIGSLMTSGHSRCLEFRVVDVTGQGGQLSLTVVQDGGSHDAPKGVVLVGRVVYGAKLDFPHMAAL